MEVLGAVASGFTLAALFKYSFDALDLIQLYQTQDVDFNRLQLQFKLEKCRLYNWGEAMGLVQDSKENLLSEWHSKDLVGETLRQIIDLFSDAQAIQKKYGCDDITASSTPSLPAHESSHGITRAFDHFRIQASNIEERLSSLKKTRWVIRDRKKFLLLVSEVRSLIDSLEKITIDLSSTARLEEFLRIRINGITNIDTLHGIASVWKESHPRVASGASTKADSLSENSEILNMIFQWRNSVDSEASGDTTLADLEDLTVTELKHFVVSSNLEVETLKNELEATSQSVKLLQHQLRVVGNDTKVQNYFLMAVVITGFLSLLLSIVSVIATVFPDYYILVFAENLYDNLYLLVLASFIMVACLYLGWTYTGAVYSGLHYLKVTLS